MAQLEEDVFEELERDVLRLGDPLALDGPLAGRREFEGGAERVVDLGCYPHPRIVAACPQLSLSAGISKCSASASVQCACAVRGSSAGRRTGRTRWQCCGGRSSSASISSTRRMPMG